MATDRVLSPFTEALQALYKAAGKPTYSDLLGKVGLKGTRPPTDSTLSDWITGETVPSPRHARFVMSLILHLEGLASSRNPRHTRQPEGKWSGLLQMARQERDDNRGGRPPREQASRSTSSHPADSWASARERLYVERDAWIAQYCLPGRLLGRDAELAELERLCAARRAGNGTGYVWWQAGPWAGKTAMMAEFVTRRRTAGVEVASYFIGERFGNNTRDGFVVSVGRQLAVLAGRAPLNSDGATEQLQELLLAAAQACEDRGSVLVLAVDGLDEDGGAGPSGGSIAALLPRNPPPGLLVVVTGRPHPQVPSDVAYGHPLLDRGIVRILAPSPEAELIRNAASRELQQLLKDEPHGPRILGLLAVARGGLTRQDLAELVGIRPHQVTQRLDGITGRSVVPEARNAADPDERAEPHSYVLGHEELRRTAVAELGPRDVSACEALVHQWADAYQAQGWPTTTPAYLLHSYPALLGHLGEADRLAAFVLDPRLQVALVDRSHVDTALAHIELTHRVVTVEGSADLGTLAALAASQDALNQRARALSPALPRAFAWLGHAERAVGLALTAAGASEKAVRLAEVVDVLARTRHPSAPQVAAECAQWARRACAEADPSEEDDCARALGAAAVALIHTAQVHEGCALLARLRGSAPSIEELACVTTARACLAARPHDPEIAEQLFDEAVQLADAITSPADPAAPIAAWAAVAGAAATPEQVARAYERIETYAAGFSAHRDASWVQASAALELVAEKADVAASFARSAAGQVFGVLRGQASADAADLLTELDVVLPRVMRALAETGEADMARDLAVLLPHGMRSRWTDKDLREEVLAIVDGPSAGSTEDAAQAACRLAEQGDSGQARRYLEAAVASRTPLPVAAGGWERALVALAGALAASGDLTDGEALALSLHDPQRQIWALARVAVECADTNRPIARRLARHAAELARELADADNFLFFEGTPGLFVAAAKGAAAQALAHTGESDTALALAKEIGSSRESAGRRALIAVAARLRPHDAATAVQLIDQERDRVLASCGGPGGASGRLGELAELLTALGDADPPCRDRLMKAVKRIWTEHKSSLDTVDLLAMVILAGEEERDKAHAFLTALEGNRKIGPVDFTEPGGFALVHAIFGDLATARASAGRDNVPASRAEALAAVASYLTGTPVNLRSTSESTSSAHLQVLHSLAMLEAPTDVVDAREQAVRFAADALAGDGWDHALPVLARIAPAAVGKVRDIVFAHRGLAPSAVSG